MFKMERNVETTSILPIFLRLQPLEDQLQSTVEILPSVSGRCTSIHFCKSLHSRSQIKTNSDAIKRCEFDQVFGPMVSEREVFASAVAPFINDLFPCSCANIRGDDIIGKSSLLFSHNTSTADYLCKSDDTITWTIEHLIVKINDKQNDKVEYELKMSFLGISDEQILDLLPNKVDETSGYPYSPSDEQMGRLELRKDNSGRSYIQGLSKYSVKSFAQGVELLSKVNIGCCQHLSMSHFVCQFEVTALPKWNQDNLDPKSTSFWVVVESQKKKQTPMINLSMKYVLSCLKNLRTQQGCEREKPSILTQGTMLTRLFSDFLTGSVDSSVGLIVNINPSIAYFDRNEIIISNVANSSHDVESFGNDFEYRDIRELRKKIINLNDALTKSQTENKMLKTKNEELMLKHDTLVVEGQDEKKRTDTPIDESKIVCSSETADFKRKRNIEKEKMLAQIPHNLKKNFRRNGFAQWNKHVLPVLFLGPYDVGPGKVRELWMKMFTRSEKDPRKLCHLVYWYGEENMSRAFSFVSESKIMTYEDGCKNGYNILPLKISKKIEACKALSYDERLIVKGLNTINKTCQSHVRDSFLPPVVRSYLLSENDCQIQGAQVNFPTKIQSSKRKKSRRAEKTLEHSIESSIVERQAVVDQRFEGEQQGYLREMTMKKIYLGCNVWVMHGVDWRCPYTAKILSTNEVENKVEVKYDVCGRKEFVSVDQVRLIEMNEGKSSRQRKAKYST